MSKDFYPKGAFIRGIKEGIPIYYPNKADICLKTLETGGAYKELKHRVDPEYCKDCKDKVRCALE